MDQLVASSHAVQAKRVEEKAQHNMRMAQEKDKSTYSHRHTAAATPEQRMPEQSMVYQREARHREVSWALRWRAPLE
jgi:hypothetical protein